MRELKSKNKLFSRPTIVFVALIIVSIFVYENELLETNQLVGFDLIFALFNYLTSYNLFYNFKVVGDSLEISNLWNPFILKTIALSDIIKIDSKVANQIGLAILIQTKDGRKRFYGIQAKKEDIEGMINFICTEIEKHNKTDKSI